MLRALRVCLACVFLIASASCGTLFNNKTETISLVGPQPGAEVIVDGVPRGHAPVLVTLSTKENHTVVFRTSNGDVTCAVRRKVGVVWVILDIIPYLTGLVVDAITGGWYELKNGCTGFFASTPRPAERKLGVTGAGQALSRITSDPLNEYQPTISPDGAVLLFDVRVLDQNVEGGVRESTIVGVDPSTGARRTLYTSNQSLSMEPGWVPDGSSFLYSSNALGTWSLVRAMSAVPNAAVTIVVHGDTAPAASTPEVSPDGRRVAFATKIRGTWTIAVADKDGANFTLFGEGTSPHWSPDGKRLVFQREVNGTNHLFTVDADTGTGLVQITTGTSDNKFPAFSPDGRYIVFQSNRGWEGKGGAQANLFLIKPDGTGLTQLTSGDVIAAQPDWGEDDWIYFTSDQAGNFDIWRLKPVGEFASVAPPPAAPQESPPPPPAAPPQP